MKNPIVINLAKTSKATGIWELIKGVDSLIIVHINIAPIKKMMILEIIVPDFSSYLMIFLSSNQPEKNPIVKAVLGYESIFIFCGSTRILPSKISIG